MVLVVAFAAVLLSLCPWWLSWLLLFLFLLLLLWFCLDDDSQCALLLLLLWLFNCATPLVCTILALFPLLWYACCCCCCSNAWLALWSLPCNEWQNFFVLLQSSFSDKLNMENDGSPVVSFTIFKNFGKQFSNFSPSSDEYVSNSIKPLHLNERTKGINKLIEQSFARFSNYTIRSSRHLMVASLIKWKFQEILTSDGWALCTRPIGSTDYWLRSSGAFCRWWSVHHRVAPANSYNRDVWFGFLFQPIDCAHVDVAMYAYMTNCPFGHASVAVLDISGHSTADNDGPHRNPENPEIHCRSAISHQLWCELNRRHKLKTEKRKTYENNEMKE